MSPSEKLVCFRVVTVTFMQREMPAYDEFGFSPQGILPNPKQRRLPSTQRLVPTIAAHIRCPFSLLVMKVPLSLTEAKSLDGFSILRQLSENAHGNSTGASMARVRRATNTVQVVLLRMAQFLPYMTLQRRTRLTDYIRTKL